MPNWVFNIVRIHGDKDTLARIKKDLHTCDKSYIDHVRAKLEGKKRRKPYDTDASLKQELDSLLAQPESNFENEFDFNSIIPMPEDSDTFCRFDGVGPDEEQKFGRNTWYEWCCDNWGTKWNANDAELEDEDDDFLRYVFNTAWAAPEPVIRELSAKYRVKVVDEFYDEDFGNNCGKLTACDGDIEFENHEHGWQWLADTFGEDTMDAFGFVQDEDGNWKREES